MKSYSLFALLALFGANTSAQTPCDSPPHERLAQAKAGLLQCGLEKVLYRSGAKVVETFLVNQGPRFSTSHGESFMGLFFLDVPGEAVVPLGEFKQRYGLADNVIAKQLGLTWDEARNVYDVLIERKNGEICAIYRMKPPYAGELASCPKGLTGTVRRESSRTSSD